MLISKNLIRLKINHKLIVVCFQSFPDKNELMRNMMGLLGNVAEVKELRPRLMQTPYIKVFSELLFSTQDGIEVTIVIN